MKTPRQILEDTLTAANTALDCANDVMNAAEEEASEAAQVAQRRLADVDAAEDALRRFDDPGFFPSCRGSIS